MPTLPKLATMAILPILCFCEKKFNHPYEFFIVYTVYTKLAEMAVLASKYLTAAKKVTSNGALTDLGVQCLTN